MPRSLIARAARASVAASLLVSLGLAPAFAHPVFAPAFSHPTFAPSHPAGKFGVGRLRGQPGFDRPFRGEPGFDRPFRGARENRRAFRAENGLRRNFSAWNGGEYGGFFPWGGGFFEGPQVASTAPPVVIAIPTPIPVPAMAPADDRAFEGGCVIHMLKYDGAGNYIGEKQYSNC